MIYFTKKGSLSEKMYIFFFLSLFFYPIYPNNLKPTVVSLFFVSALILSIKNKSSFNWKNYYYNKWFIINSGIFFILTASLFYTSDIVRGGSFVFRLLPLLVFPLSFRLIDRKEYYSEDMLDKSLKIFYLSTIILFVGFIIYFYLNGNITQFFFRDYNERINTKLGKFNIHPIYASIYICLALLFSIRLYNKRVINPRIILILNLILVSELILLSRKSTIILMLLIYLLYLFLFSKIRLVQKWMIVGLLAIIACVVLFFIPDVTNRFMELVELNSNMNNRGSVSLRYNILSCSWSSILESPLIGHGLGSDKEVLMECYQNNQRVFNGTFYNSHNQYLSVMLVSGILGLLSLLWIVFFNLFNSIRNGDYIFAGTMILFTLLMLVENILERQEGVIPFALFVNFLSFRNYMQIRVLNK